MVLESPELSVVVVPEEGGRIGSLRSVGSGLEFLTQAREDRGTLSPGLDTAFRDGPCAGIEECLPTVGPCFQDEEAAAVSDHGDFWQRVWTVLDAPSDTSMRMQAEGFSRPLRFWKELTVKGRALQVCYRVENIGGAPTSFLYACHPLFAIRAGDRVVLHREVEALQLYYSRDHRLGMPGSTIPWSTSAGQGAEPDLSVTDLPSAGTAEMLYTDRLSRGRCGLYRARERQGVVVSFDTAHLPYLGLWLCYGGWPDPPGTLSQYAVALEPTSAPCNTLQEAQARNLARALPPGGIATWQITFTITDSDLSFASFQQQVDAF